MTDSLRTLLTGLVDYAGLFPPARLAMAPAAETFARARVGEHAWMLGRFICPASRLEEFSAAAASLMPGTHATSGYPEYADVTEPWRVSVIIDGDLRRDLEALAAFNRRHEEQDHGQAVADAVEIKAADSRAVESALELVPDEIFPFFEFPATGDCRGLIAALAGSAAAAKIRTGGVTADAFPAPADVAAFIAACAAAEVPFKATAGLHHPLRAEHPLTYEPGCPRATMHGFINLFLAAAFIMVDNADIDDAAAVLESRNPDDFHFTDEGVRWKGRFLETAQVALAREVFALSYGSCSFDEPVNDLRALGLL